MHHPNWNVLVLPEHRTACHQVNCPNDNIVLHCKLTYVHKKWKGKDKLHEIRTRWIFCQPTWWSIVSVSFSSHPVSSSPISLSSWLGPEGKWQTLVSPVDTNSSTIDCGCVFSSASGNDIQGNTLFHRHPVTSIVPNPPLTLSRTRDDGGGSTSYVGSSSSLAQSSLSSFIEVWAAYLNANYFKSLSKDVTGWWWLRAGTFYQPDPYALNEWLISRSCRVVMEEGSSLLFCSPVNVFYCHWRLVLVYSRKKKMVMDLFIYGPYGRYSVDCLWLKRC